MSLNKTDQLDEFFALAEDSHRFSSYRLHQTVFFGSSIVVYTGSCILALIRLFPGTDRLSHLFWLIAGAFVVNAVYAFRLNSLVGQRWIALHALSVFVMALSQAVFLFSDPSWLARPYIGTALMVASVMVSIVSVRMASELATDAEEKSIRQIKETRMEAITLFGDTRNTGANLHPVLVPSIIPPTPDR